MKKLLWSTVRIGSGLAIGEPDQSYYAPYGDHHHVISQRSQPCAEHLTIGLLASEDFVGKHHCLGYSESEATTQPIQQPELILDGSLAIQLELAASGQKKL